MGMYLSAYCGPYVSCRFRKGQTREKTVRFCPNEKCQRTGKENPDPFCSSCGTKIVSQKVTTPLSHHPLWYEVLGEDDTLTPLIHEYKDEFYLGPNTRKTPRKFTLEENEDHADLASVDRESEMDWFRSRYARELGLLLAEYDDVKVCWGVHLWYS